MQTGAGSPPAAGTANSPFPGTRNTTFLESAVQLAGARPAAACGADPLAKSVLAAPPSAGTILISRSRSANAIHRLSGDHTGSALSARESVKRTSWPVAMSLTQISRDDNSERLIASRVPSGEMELAYDAPA